MRYPTQLEADALVSLIPDEQPEELAPLTVLPEIFQFLQSREVAAFLFTTEPIQLSHLASPLLDQTATVANVQTTRVDKNFINPLSDFVDGNGVFIPAFTSGKLNFGFGIHQHMYSPISMWQTSKGGYRRLGESRFVRNEENGLLVVAIDSVELGVVRIDYARLVNSSTQIRSVLRFERKKFREAQRQGFADVQKLVDALEWIQTAFEVRDCPVCRVRFSLCQCTLQDSRSRHPLDFRGFVRNMHQRFGTFEGFGRMSLFRNGKLAHATDIGCRMIAEPNRSKGMLERLRAWAIQAHSKTWNPHPLLTIPHKESIGEDEILTLDTSTSVLAPSSGACANVAEESRTWVICGDVERSGRQISDEVYLPQCDSTRNILSLVYDQNSADDGAQDVGSGSSQIQLDAKSDGNSHNGILSDSQEDARPPKAKERKTKQKTATMDDIRKLRLELRKERNRAAATRSNMRRKAANDERKRELQSNKERAILLRSQEASLRRENMLLRRQLVEKAVEG